MNVAPLYHMVEHCCTFVWSIIYEHWWTVKSLSCKKRQLPEQVKLDSVGWRWGRFKFSRALFFLQKLQSWLWKPFPRLVWRKKGKLHFKNCLPKPTRALPCQNKLSWVQWSDGNAGWILSRAEKFKKGSHGCPCLCWSSEWYWWCPQTMISTAINSSI